MNRRPIDFGIGNGDNPRILRYQNVPVSIGAVVSSKLATLHELQTIYGMGDLYDMLEIISIDAHNINQAQKNG